MGLSPQSLVHLLEHMITELLGGIEQLPEKMICLAVLIGQESGYRVKPERLMEKPPVQSPSIAIRQ